MVSVFQIADNAVSYIVYASLLERNKAKLSARSYAYRSDITVHDAVQYMLAELDGVGRLYIAEFDFRSFFDSIDHDHVRRVLRDGRFLITPEEACAIEAFMTVPASDAASYTATGGPSRTRGVPLGTSISLFLADVAAWPLDRRLERLGVGYVRYADDTFMWSRDYSRLTAAVDALNEEVQAIGSELNYEKSPGIRLFADARARAELPAAEAFTFIGHTFKRTEASSYNVSLSLGERKLKALKARVEHLIYYNLLHEPLHGTQDPSRLGSVDRDYVTLIWQLRRLLYGRLSERQLRRALNGGIHAVRLSGILAHYPLIDDVDQLIDFDKWVAERIWLSMRKRSKILSSIAGSLPPPHGVSVQRLVSYQYTSRSTGGVLDIRVPSARRMADLVRQAATIHGPNTVGRIDPAGY